MIDNKSYKGLYYIQDTRSYVGNSVLFWGPSKNGYTTDISQAGLYNEKQAINICANRETDKMLPAELVHKCANLTLDVQALRKEMEEVG